MNLTTTKKLNNGVEIPMLGLGVFRCKDQEGVNCVKWALEAGYRHIDTAALYENEEAVGQGIRESGVDRKDVFVTTKLAVTDMREGNVEAAFDKSLKLLGMDYVDMYLIHWPEPGKVKQTWAVLEKLYKEGRARAIGVSNFNKEHLDLLRDFEVVPAMNQMEFHPELVQPELRAYCEQLGIAYEAWSPLGNSTVLGLPTINEIAQKHGKSAAQVIIRWDLQHGVITIPKSVHQNRIIENSQVFDFELSQEEMDAIDACNTGRHNGPNPDTAPVQE